MNLADMNYIEILKNKIIELEQELEACNVEREEYRKYSKELEEDNKELTILYDNILEGNHKLQDNIKELKNILEIERCDGDCYIDSLKEELEDYKQEMFDYKNYSEVLESQLDNKDDEIRSLEDDLHSSIGETEQLQNYIKELEEENNSLKIENAKLIKENREIENKNNRLQNIINEMAKDRYDKRYIYIKE